MGRRVPPPDLCGDSQRIAYQPEQPSGRHSRPRPWIRLKKKVITAEKRKEYCGHHEEIIEAISRRNSAGASEMMQRHISAIIEDLFPR
ncbi:FCD domain-containing protein [Seohaeicola zhoushanensis]